MNNQLPALYVEYLSTEDPALQQYGFEVIDLTYDEKWPELWALLVGVAELPGEVSAKAMAVVAAGPLEDLLAKAGRDYIDMVLDLAKRNRRFSLILTGVWKSSIEAPVWERVVAFCRSAPEAIDGVYRY